MSEYVKVTIDKKTEKKKIEFIGRLIGIITQNECRAIINTKNAARRIFSAEGIALDDLPSNCSNKRLVIATSEYSSDKKREIFISPTILFYSWSGNTKSFKCEDGNWYRLDQLHGKEK